MIEIPVWFTVTETFRSKSRFRSVGLPDTEADTLVSKTRPSRALGGRGQERGLSTQTIYDRSQTDGVGLAITAGVAAEQLGGGAPNVNITVVLAKLAQAPTGGGASRALKTIDPLARVSTVKYDGGSAVVERRDPHGVGYNAVFDVLGRETSRTDTHGEER
jgi:hypothetical protein